MKTSRTSRASFPRSSSLAFATLCKLARLICFICTFSAGTALADRELHVVGVYEGTDGTTTHGAVFVNRPGQSVTLFLSAYDSINWQVTLGPGTTLERVFLSGYYVQSVQGVPAGVPVFRSSYEENISYLYIGYTPGSSTLIRAIPKINAMTGQEIASFHGEYRAPAAPFIIDAVQDDPWLSASYPQPVPLSDLPDLHFQIATYDPNSVTLHDYTLAGPVNGGSLIPGSIRVSSDAAHRFYYGGSEGLIGFDSQTGATQVIPLPENVQREGWQMGTAFDRLRNRALVVTLAGEGFVYSFTPATQQWGTVFSMRNRDFDCLEYHDADDTLYGITLSHGDYQRAHLIGLSAADGALRKDIELPVLPFDIEPGGHRSELVSVGDYLVLLLEPQNWNYIHGDNLQESRMYLIDPRTGGVWLTQRSSGPPNKPPTVQIVSPADGSAVTPGSIVRLTAAAFDQDGSIAFVEFRVDGDSVGFGIRGANDQYTLDWTAPASGQHEITAIAKDNRDATATSEPVTVKVNRRPTVQMTTPANGSSFVKLSIVQLVAAAEDADGTIATVQFMVDGIIIGNGKPVAGTNQFSLPWVARDAGSHIIKARAVDNQGASTTSDGVSVTVTSEASRATRLLPAQYQPGRKFRVGILVKPGRDTVSYSVVERPPTGWTISEISDGGVYDAASGEVRFGPIENDHLHLLTYSVKPPPKAKGIQIFSGEVIADGISSRIGGKQTIGRSKFFPQALRRFSIQ